MSAKKASTKLLSPYYCKELYYVVPLHPSQMDSQINLHVKNNLHDSVLGKCIEYGYVCAINKIEIKDVSFMEEDLSAQAHCNVIYHAIICSPTIGTFVLFKIDYMTQNFIRAVNGPIETYIESHKYDPEHFIVNPRGELEYVLAKKDEKKKSKKVEIGDIFKLRIIGKIHNNGERKILVTGEITSMATPDEIEQFNEQTKIGDKTRNVRSNVSLKR